jgi:hypothetical protein
MTKKTTRVRPELNGVERDEKVARKRVNVVLDEDIHEEGIKLAESLRMDFSALVNVMLETALSAEERDTMVTSMYATILRRHGLIVTKDHSKVKDEKWHREQAKKRKK